MINHKKERTGTSQEQKFEGKKTAWWRLLIAVVICLYMNLLVCSILYEPVMSLFNVNIDGFMNFNGIFVAVIIWICVSIVALFLANSLKNLLSVYYKIIRRTQVVFIVVPFFVFIIILMLLAMK